MPTVFSQIGIHVGIIGKNDLSSFSVQYLISGLTIEIHGKTKALEEIQKVKYGLETGLSGNLLAIDIRQALYHFGEITGEITNDDLLGNIFANFCIGK